MRVLRDKYGCQVPTTFEELLALPGVGRKSANPVSYTHLDVYKRQL